MNGQHFQFHGYLPLTWLNVFKSLKELETLSRRESSAQIFNETPYRNNVLLESILKICTHTTRLCIAVNLTGKAESIQTKTIEAWKNKVPDINKQPAIFILPGVVTLNAER